MTTNYDRWPAIKISSNDADCRSGWSAVGAALVEATAGGGKCVLVVECYPGTDIEEIFHKLVNALHPANAIMAEDALKDQPELGDLFAPWLGDDPVFGKMYAWQLGDFLCSEKVARLRRQLDSRGPGLTIILGTGASIVANGLYNILVYTDLARWEIQQRQRAHKVGNLGAHNSTASAAELYKRAYFIDWRAADRHRTTLLQKIDFYLDTNIPGEPRMIDGDTYRLALAKTCERPFRVVPFFDPGPWGGEWMRRHFNLPREPANFAWCFDCVPEENSVRFQFGSTYVECPAVTLVHTHPLELLGQDIYDRLGAEFPIRFDLLDTMGGGNLSLQVHPLPSYIQEHYGLIYTQDESYYLLDAEPEAVVYLGLRENVVPSEMVEALTAAQAGGVPFDAEDYVNTWPAAKHSHFSIPAGTIHCSGRNSLVLEVSATPYIFTFKLWDWQRLGLNGKPRPIHLTEGVANIQWDRTTNWVKQNLIDLVCPITSGPGWREESTGLHVSQFLETRRHWFTQPVDHNTNGTLNVLNLVDGSEAIVESPTGAFDPLPVHYAETFIVPASVGAYRIRPSRNDGTTLATIKAYVRR